MTDDEFLRAFEDCMLETFRHRDHLRLAWLYLRRHPYGEALAAIERSIRRFAEHHGATGKYHQTMTVAWMRLMAAAMAAGPREPFDALLEDHPQLLDPAALRIFYSKATLESDAARHHWVEPDQGALP
jgi:hypothetical protein